MAKPLLTQNIEKVVALKIKAVDRVIEEMIDPIAAVGNPEKLIRKPYEQWTPQDLQMLIQIYGTGDKTPLSRLIFDREYEKVKSLEAEEMKL